MDNKEIARAFNEVYNSFWLRFRDCNIAKDDEVAWKKIMEEVQKLIDKYPGYALVEHMVTDLVMELDHRARRK